MENELRVVRARRRKTQLQIALRTGINQTRISHIENGLIDPTEDEAKAIARELDTTPEAIFPGGQQPSEAR